MIHWHPFTAKASGANAKLKVFLDNYGVKLSDGKLTFPEEQGGAVYEEGVTKCLDDDGKEVDGQLKAFVWPLASNTNDFRVLAADLDGVRITDNGMGITIAFVPGDVDSIPAPPTAANLAELGAVDGGDVLTTTTIAGENPVSETTVPGDTTVPGETTVPGAATVVTSATDGSAAAETTSTLYED